MVQKVMKFGGSCLKDWDTVERMVSILQDSPKPLVIVLSALHGSTDQLLDLAQAAVAGEIDISPLRRRHEEVFFAPAAALGPEPRARFEAELDELKRILQALALLGEIPPRVHDRILSFGERLSVLFVTALLQSRDLPAKAFVADEAGIFTDGRAGDAGILASSKQEVRRRFAGLDGIAVVTGFLGRDAEGCLTTLGRGGSDYTAAFIAAALEAPLILWKDTAGLLSGDPRVVAKPREIRRCHYEDLLELAHYGLPAVHEKAIYPAMAAGCPIEIHAFHGGSEPTIISSETGDALAITSVEDVVIFDLVARGARRPARLLRVLARILDLLAERSIFPLLLSEASPRGETQLVVKGAQRDQLASSLGALCAEVELSERVGLAVVSLIGSSMAGKVGFAARVFECLGAAEINIVAIAQTASERNISVIVERGQARMAVRALHRRFIEDE